MHTDGLPLMFPVLSYRSSTIPAHDHRSPSPDVVSLVPQVEPRRMTAILVNGSTSIPRYGELGHHVFCMW